ncbi:MAG: hypothetical protein V4641_16440 [Pseudomonadota bacterium]
MSGFNVDLSELAGLVASVRKFGAVVQDEVAMAGVAAGARVLYVRAKTLAPMSDKVHTFYGRNSKKSGVTYTFAPGNLRNAIFRAFQPEKSGPTNKSYRISWNHIKAPYGHMVEFGTSKASAHSFIGASLSELPEAYRYAKIAMADQLLEIGGRR